MSSDSLLVHSENATRSTPKSGMRVWIRPTKETHEAYHNMSGYIESASASGRVKVLFDADCVLRRKGMMGVRITPCLLTTVNPFAK